MLNVMHISPIFKVSILSDTNSRHDGITKIGECCYQCDTSGIPNALHQHIYWNTDVNNSYCKYWNQPTSLLYTLDKTRFCRGKFFPPFRSHQGSKFASRCCRKIIDTTNFYSCHSFDHNAWTVILYTSEICESQIKVKEKHPPCLPNCLLRVHQRSVWARN